MHRRKNRIYSMILTGFFATLMCIGAWVHFPFAVPVTMQTFVAMCSLGLLGCRRTFYMLGIYIMLGSAGLPVFSGFTGGIGALAGPTAGFIWGFLLGVPVFYLTEKCMKDSSYKIYIGYIIYIIIHYIPGALWYTYFTAKTISISGVIAASSITVLPFVIPDAVKVFLSVFIVKRLKPVLNKMSIN